MIDALEQAGIAYLLVGAFSSNAYNVNPGSHVVLREFSGGECRWQGASGKTTTPRDHSLATDHERRCPRTFPLVTATRHSHLPLGLHLAAALPRCGVARSTKDADFVVSLQSGDLRRLLDRLGPDFRLDPQMKLEVITGSVRYVITFLPTNFDIELFRLTDGSHHAERFRRKQRVQLGELNRDVWLPTAEDVIIQKLRWQRRKDLDDVVNILAVRADRLDWEYLSKRANLHGSRRNWLSWKCVLGSPWAS